MLRYNRTMQAPKLPPILHFALFDQVNGTLIAPNSNAGDTLLQDATRALFDLWLGTNDWRLELLWKKANHRTIATANHCRAVVVGGGGLLLRDQKGAEESCSGWQWNCPLNQLSNIYSPLIVFGIGFNRFRSQPDYESVFNKHISATVKKSVFFGLRNKGSIKALSGYLDDPKLASRLLWQPCPSTLGAFLYPRFTSPEHMTPRRMAVNIAFDRRELRFGQSENTTLSIIATALKTYSKKGWDIHLVNHKPQDVEFRAWLIKENVPHKITFLHDATPSDILSFYSSCSLVVGMRGHAQMIPFGLQRNVLSIISHDKIRWFLDDIDHPEWGVDVADASFADKLNSNLKNMTSKQPEKIRNQAIKAQQKLWSVTSKNMSLITSLVECH